MKMSKILSLILVVVMVLSCFVGCFGPKDDGNKDDTNKPSGDTGNTGETENPEENEDAYYAELAGEYVISMWVSEKEGVAEQFQEQIAAFNELYKKYNIVVTASIEGVTEADAGSKVVADVASAPDIYCFAQDQLARLVQAAALAQPVEKIANEVKATNDAGSVAAGSIAGELYAYPMTSDNGYYLYYDTSIISNPESLEDIIAACEANGKTFRYALENAWYTASFFFATGCHSQWTTNEAGDFNGIDDTFNSPEGLIAMKGMQKLAQSSCYDSNADIFTNAGAIVTGIWNATAAAEHFGENLGATDLPSFTVDGKSYHLGSYTGNKLMGVKPQETMQRNVVLGLLAQYLTGEECQKQRFESFEWGPSNLVAQQSDAVQANPSLAALALQGNYGIPQGQIHGSWWDIAKVLGAQAKDCTTDAQLQDALNAYDAAIEGVLGMTEEEKAAWGVIGGICGTNWDTDFTMTKVSDGVWESEPLALNQGEQFKLRQGAAWDVQVGADGQMKTPEIEPANIVVDQTGTFVIRLEWDGTSTVATVTFLPA